MGSEQNDGTSYQPSQPTYCANNCGFFGNPSTMNLCSKCYRDYRMKEEQAASAKAAMEKSLNPKSSSASKIETVAAALLVESSSASSSSASVSPPVVSGGDQGEPKLANRCRSCNKKVGLTGFKCKCGMTFCGSHRYPENHECTFDFKEAGRDKIAKANPVVKADKLEKF